MITRLAAALGAAALLAVSPVQAQDGAANQERVRKFAELPYWPGYWVSEGAAGTPISGIALRTGGPTFDSVGIWAARTSATRFLPSSFHGIRCSQMPSASSCGPPWSCLVNRSGMPLMGVSAALEATQYPGQ